MELRSWKMEGWVLACLLLYFYRLPLEGKLKDLRLIRVCCLSFDVVIFLRFVVQIIVQSYSLYFVVPRSPGSTHVFL